MNNLVSILIPLYNSEKFIIKTIESCLLQTYENIEIIIIDDGSTDDSLTIVRDYEKKYDNIKVFTQLNSGAQRARNLAFEKSSGKYIQYLDADDLLSINKITSQMTLIEKFGDTHIYSSKFMRFIDVKEDAFYQEKRIDRSFDDSIDWLATSWSNGGMGQTSIWLTPRKLIEKAGTWNEQLHKNQDGEFFSRVLVSADKVIYSNDAIVYYRKTGSNSISYQMSEKAAKVTLLSYSMYEENTREIANPKLNKAIAYCYLSFINHYYPNFPFLLKEAELSMLKLGFNYSSLEVGGKFGLFSRVIGHKNTMRIRYLFRLLSKGENLK